VRALEVVVLASARNEDLHGRNGADVWFTSSALCSGTAENGLRNDSVAIIVSAKLRTSRATRNGFADSLHDWTAHSDGLASEATLRVFTFNNNLLFNVFSNLFLDVALILTTLVWECLLWLGTIAAAFVSDVLITEAEFRTAARREY